MVTYIPSNFRHVWNMSGSWCSVADPLDGDMGHAYMIFPHHMIVLLWSWEPRGWACVACGFRGHNWIHFCSYAKVYCYLEFKHPYLEKNLKLFLIREKKYLSLFAGEVTTSFYCAACAFWFRTNHHLIDFTYIFVLCLEPVIGLWRFTSPANSSIVLQRKVHGFLLFFKAFSWETDL